MQAEVELRGSERTLHSDGQNPPLLTVAAASSTSWCPTQAEAKRLAPRIALADLSTDNRSLQESLHANKDIKHARMRYIDNTTR